MRTVSLPDGESRRKESFIEAYANTENALLVDVRTPEEFASGHIADAINCNAYESDFVDALVRLSAKGQIFLYCRSGGRSHAALQVLRERGIEAVELEGGLLAHPELVTR